MHEIIVAGRSNVGKSSIIRELTGKKVKTGKRPGVTQEFERLELGKKLHMLDLPGFGHIAGMSDEKEEKIKTEIVRYLEENEDKILLAIQVVDAPTFPEIAERWNKRGQIPIDVELFSFLRKLNLNPIVAANKIDKVRSDETDQLLDEICVELELDPPWRQWIDVIVPTSAKTGKGINKLKDLVRQRIRDSGKDNLLQYI